MEKLILRGVMWGADKIPDPWFEKIPGGYYKAKEESQKKPKRAATKKRRTRRYSDDEYSERDDRPDRDDGYRSEGGHGRRSKSDKQYDGGHDFDEINNRPRRGSSKARRHRNDDDKYGYADGHGGRDRRNGAGGGVQYGSGGLPPEQQAHPIPPGADPYVAGAAAAARAARAQLAQAGPPSGPSSPFSHPRSPQQHLASNHSRGSNPINPAVGSTSTLRGAMATGYVPYAHIYGGPAQSNGYSGFVPPPSSTGSVHPDLLSQLATPVASPPHDYQQNPYAQQAPTGIQPGHVPGAYWQERQYQSQHGGHGSRRDGSRDRHRRDDYESSEESYSPPPRRRRSRRSRRDRSSSRDSHPDGSRRSRRARSKRPSTDGTAAPSAARGPAAVRPPPPYPPYHPYSPQHGPQPPLVNPHQSSAPQTVHHSPSPPLSSYSRTKQDMRARARSGCRSD